MLYLLKNVKLEELGLMDTVQGISDSLHKFSSFLLLTFLYFLLFCWNLHIELLISLKIWFFSLLLSRLFQIPEGALDRCIQFTYGFSFASFRNSLEEYFKGFSFSFLFFYVSFFFFFFFFIFVLQEKEKVWIVLHPPSVPLSSSVELFAKLDHLLKHMRKSCGMEFGAEAPSNLRRDRSKDFQDDEFEESPSYEQNWSHFHGALKVYELCFRISEKAQAFEQKVREKVLCSFVITSSLK